MLEKKIPLSSGQRQLWFLEQLARGKAGYTLLDAFQIHGPLDVALLERCFAELSQRHESLRACFQEVDGQPVQIIAEHVDFTLARFDLKALPAGVREEQAKKIAAQELIQPIHLERCPLWRATLIQLNETDHWVLLTIHHIIFDGWSSGLFWEELIELYQSAMRRAPRNEPEVAAQISDFVRWEQQYLQGESLDRLVRYWKQKLGGATVPLELPTDFARPLQPSFQGGDELLVLPRVLGARIREFAKMQRTTIFITLLAAYKVFLFRYTNENEISVGTPFASRSRADHESILGFLVNTLVLRSRLEREQSFVECLAVVQQTALEAYEHGDMPFSLLVEAVRPERDMSHNPLFQTMFQMNGQRAIHAPDAGLVLNPIILETYAANFDLTLEVIERSDDLVLRMEYATDLFLPSTIRRLLDNFRVLLEQIVAEPRQRIGDLLVMSQEERQLLLDVWSRSDGASAGADPMDVSISLKRNEVETTGEVVQQGKRLTDAELVSVLEQFVNQVRRGEPIKLGGEARKWVWREFGGGGELDSSGWCLHSFFHQQVSKAPDRIAVSHEGKDLTYGELNAAANQLAHELIARGVSTDKPVGLFLDRSFDMVIAILAILKAGGPYLPLDPDYPDERVRFMLEDARVEIVVTRSDLSEKLPSLAASLLCMDQERFTLEGRSKSNPDVCVNPADLAYIIYTSGSSGRPKGVMIEHRAAAHFVHAAMSHYGMDSSDCMLQFGSISFDLAVEEIFTCLAAGGRLRLRTKEMLGTPARFLQCCQDWGVTILDLPTAYWQQLVTEMAHTGSRFPAGVRLVIIGGERVVPSVVELWQRHVGDYPRLFNSYGPTEATVVATGHWIGGSMKPRHEVPIGRPLSNSEVYILDSELRAVPIGVPGELYLGGRSLARGYLNLPELTANRFIANPFHPERDARLYKTGDRARYLSDGTIEFLGRLDHQVKLRGFRIELGEIESALLRFPGIKEAVVLAQNDGSGSQFLAAYVVTQSKEMVSEQVVKTFLRQSLPGYMIPLFVRSLRCLPLDPNGKIDVRALPVPSPVDHPSGDRPFACPSSPLEEKLAAIWCDVLRVPKVSVSDRFFDLGGHSLQAVQIMTRIRREIGVELPLSALFESPSVEEMSKRLGKAGFEASWSPLVPFQAGGRKRPFFAIHGGHGEVLFYKSLSKHLGGDQPFYALRAKGNDFPGMPDQSVEEMATCYTQAIREIQPAGPYRIGGASFGGIVAFEMAQQLHAAGETVELLVLFDTGGFREFTKPLPLPTRLLNLFRYLPRYGFEETWHRLRVRLLRLFVSDSVVEFYRATGTLPKKSSDTIGRWEGVWKANLAASERYVPRVYPGAISLIRARDDGNYMWFDCDPGYGWDEYAGGGVIGYDVPGTHIGMFQEPYVKDLAQTMVRLLEGRAAAI